MECTTLCINNGKLCHKCYNEEYLKLPKERKKKTYTHNNKDANAKDSWKTLEKAVAMGLSNVPSIKEARRSRASGALEFVKGDVVDELMGQLSHSL